MGGRERGSWREETFKWMRGAQGGVSEKVALCTLHLHLPLAYEFH